MLNKLRNKLQNIREENVRPTTRMKVKGNIKDILFDVVTFKKHWNGWSLINEKIDDFVLERAHDEGWCKFRFFADVDAILRGNELELYGYSSQLYKDNDGDYHTYVESNLFWNQLKMIIKLDNETVDYLKNFGDKDDYLDDNELGISIVEILEIAGENLIDEAQTLQQDLEDVLRPLKQLDIKLDSLIVISNEQKKRANICIEGKFLVYEN